MMTSVGAICTTIQAICTVINLIFVVGVFFVNKWYDKTNAVKEREEFWYHELMLRRGINEIRKAFGKIKGYINQAEDVLNDEPVTREESFKNVLNSINRQIASLKMILLTYTGVFDDNLKRTIKSIIEEFQDRLSSGLEEWFTDGKSNSKLAQVIIEEEGELLKKIYRYEKRKIK